MALFGPLNRSLIFVVLLILIPWMIASCGPSVATQSEQDKAKEQVSATELQKKSSTEGDVTVLVGAQKAPPPTAGPPPPQPPRTTPASYYEPVGPFFFYVETLTSNNTTKYGVAASTPCVQSGVFKRGMAAGFTTAAPWLPIADDFSMNNVAVLRDDVRSILTLYHRLIELRRAEPALSVGDYSALPAGDDLVAYMTRSAPARLASTTAPAAE